MVCPGSPLECGPLWRERLLTPGVVVGLLLLLLVSPSSSSDIWLIDPRALLAAPIWPPSFPALDSADVVCGASGRGRGRGALLPHT